MDDPCTQDEDLVDGGFEQACCVCAQNFCHLEHPRPCEALEAAKCDREVNASSLTAKIN